MGGLSWWHWLLIVLAFVVLFGAKRLPDAARGLGRSMRILKSEVSELHKDGEDTPATEPKPTAAAPQPVIPAPAPIVPVPAPVATTPAPAAPVAAVPVVPAPVAAVPVVPAPVVPAPGVAAQQHLPAAEPARH